MPAAVGEDAQQDEEREQRAGGDMAERRAERERARQQQLRPAPGRRVQRLREQVVDLTLGQVQRAVDQVLPELVDRLDGAGLHGGPLPR